MSEELRKALERAIRAEADAAALRRAAVAVVKSAHDEDEPVEVPNEVFAALLKLADVLDAANPGAALLAELEAARALIDAVEQFLARVLGPGINHNDIDALSQALTSYRAKSRTDGRV